MLKSKPILRFVIILACLVNIVLFPIGRVLTNADKLNGIFDAVGFERIFLTAYTEILSSQLPAGISDNMKEEISKSIINESQLRTQRVKNVEQLLTAIENKEEPEIVFDIENPANKLKTDITAVTDGIKDTLLNFTEEIRCEEDSSVICSLINSILPDQGEELDISQDDLEEIKDFAIKTNLGVTQENIEKVNTTYKILQYGPEALLLLIIILALIGYALTVPDLTFAKKLAVNSIVVIFWALSFWGSLPIIFKSTNPIKFTFTESTYSVENSINQGIGDALTQMSREGILLAFAIAASTVMIYFLLMIITKNNRTVEQIRQSRKEEEVYKGKDSAEDEADDDEGEELIIDD